MSGSRSLLPWGMSFLALAPLILISVRVRRAVWLHARLVVALGYIFTIGVLADLVVAPRQTTCSDGDCAFVATRTLRVNHRLRLDDFTIPSELPATLHWKLPDRSALEGRYLAGQVTKGERVTSLNTSPWPAFDGGKDAKTTPISIATGEDLVDAGSLVDICPTVGDCLGTVTVVAVIRKDANTSYAIVAVPNDRVSVVSAALQKGAQLRLRAL